MNKDIRTQLANCRIAGIDFGLKRVGVAVCDELHISISPKAVLDYTLPTFWVQLFDLLCKERVNVIVIGNPVRKGNIESKLSKSIDEFIALLNAEHKFSIYKQDESMSSINALDTMLNNGTKKKARREKGNIDKVAAAIILKDFLNENLW